MQISFRDLMTVCHGMVFGVLTLLLALGAINSLYATVLAPAPWRPVPGEQRALRGYFLALAGAAWLAVLSGAYLIYPWYRAIPPAGVTDLSLYPQHLLLASPRTALWHEYGMEWKEHVAWFAPIAATMVAYVYLTYGAALHALRQLRGAVLGFAAVAFAAAAVAALCGAFLNKYAPVHGGPLLTLAKGD